MLFQPLLRIALSDLKPLQQIAQRQRDLQEERSSVQAVSNRIGKEVGSLIKNGQDSNSAEISKLRELGNKTKQKVSSIEEEEKQISSNLHRDEIDSDASSRGTRKYLVYVHCKRYIYTFYKWPNDMHAKRKAAKLPLSL